MPKIVYVAENFIYVRKLMILKSVSKYSERKGTIQGSAIKNNYLPILAV